MLVGVGVGSAVPGGPSVGSAVGRVEPIRSSSRARALLSADGACTRPLTVAASSTAAVTAPSAAPIPRRRASAAGRCVHDRHARASAPCRIGIST